MIKKIEKKIKGSIVRKIKEHQNSVQFRKELISLKEEIDCLYGGNELSEPKAAAVLLSYKRPKNLPLITKSLLRNEYISRVIISNNNPELKLEDWFDFTDERLKIINQPVRRLPGYRFEIARHIEEQYFIFIDDDLFLRPSQITTLYKALLDDPSVPHGVWGQKIHKDGDQYTVKNGVREYNGEIDVINRAYFLTRNHLNKFIKILHCIGIEHIEDLKFVDDIVLSFSGNGRPRCHDVGHLIDCPSKDMNTVAVWRENNFFSDRIEFYKQMIALERSEMNADKIFPFHGEPIHEIE